MAATGILAVLGVCICCVSNRIIASISIPSNIFSLSSSLWARSQLAIIRFSQHTMLGSIFSIFICRSDSFSSCSTLFLAFSLKSQIQFGCRDYVDARERAHTLTHDTHTQIERIHLINGCFSPYFIGWFSFIFGGGHYICAWIRPVGP